MITGGKLLLPCEVGVKTVLPAVRALMARTIVEKHGMKEEQAAEILDLSQSAVSKYVTKTRGNTLAIENVAEVQALVDKMITFLIHEPDRKMELLKLFCQTCKIIREKGLMCQLCQENVDKSWIETCTFCRSV
jgi:predicted transcriptional regulator